MHRNITLLLLSFIIYSCQSEDPPPEQNPMDLLLKISLNSSNDLVDSEGKEFIPWGFNYTNPEKVGLIEDRWDIESTWDIISEDFEEMKDLSANVVRIHLQAGKFLNSSDEVNHSAYEKLKRLADLAEDQSLYLIVTGLAAYRREDTPEWYQSLSDQDRWKAHLTFWENIASTLNGHNAILAYDLINEPVISNDCEGMVSCEIWPDDTLLDEFQFIQRISLNAEENYFETLAVWIVKMKEGIRLHDAETLITTGVLPLGPITTLESELDIISTHLYPDSGDLQKTVDFVLSNQGQKPFLIEEIFNLNCTISELEWFLEEVDGKYAGLIGHYFGRTIEQYTNPDIQDALRRNFLTFFKENNPND